MVQEMALKVLLPPALICRMSGEVMGLGAVTPGAKGPLLQVKVVAGVLDDVRERKRIAMANCVDVERSMLGDAFLGTGGSVINWVER